MLVLSRKVGEKIIIGDNIVIEVGDIGSGRVRLLLTAPQDVPIYRSELLDPPRQEAPCCRPGKAP